MKCFKISIPSYIKNIISALAKDGFEAYVVGGCVRDALLGKVANDWDVCTSAKPEEVKLSLSDFEVIETGIAHGTVTAVSDGNVCEITTFRCEGKYTDHRHPDSVSFTSDILEDLKRRDFTVNAMAYSEELGLIDAFGGTEDLKNRIIRCVGTPENRFSEDALRIMRALRFSATLDFSIEENTQKAISELFPLLGHVASERVTNELKRLLCGNSAHDIISRHKAVFDFIFKTDISLLPEDINSLSPDVSLRLAFLLANKEPSDAKELLRNLKFDNATIASVTFLLENKSKNLSLEKTSAMKLLSEFGKDKLSLLSEFLIGGSCEDYKDFIKDLPVLTVAELEINGNDLLRQGIPAGKKIRELLSSLLTAVIEEKCKNEKGALLDFLNKLI